MRAALLRGLIWAFFMSATILFVVEYTTDLLTRITLMFLLLLLGKTVELRIKK